ncbi:hypothetical protein HZH68_014548 [Vespula germanica]|uniref:Uncharacterized protein n=1 Tax=Vespula germanica TaxID=30212 RepID=A0A834JDU6_VESGE|nr:hypothetical protein HZH68_014548 [Vespula germanica]
MQGDGTVNSADPALSMLPTNENNRFWFNENSSSKTGFVSGSHDIPGGGTTNLTLLLWLCFLFLKISGGGTINFEATSLAILLIFENNRYWFNENSSRKSEFVSGSHDMPGGGTYWLNENSSRKSEFVSGSHDIPGGDTINFPISI